MLRVVEVGVNTFRCCDSRMPQELLDILHGNTRMPKHCGTGVSKVMESDDSEMILLEEFLKSPCDPVDLISFAILPDEDVVVVLVVVHLAKGLLPFLLFGLHIEEHVLDDSGWIKRKGSKGLLGLRRIIGDLHPSSIDDGFGDHVLDGEFCTGSRWRPI